MRKRRGALQLRKIYAVGGYSGFQQVLHSNEVLLIEYMRGRVTRLSAITTADSFRRVMLLDPVDILGFWAGSRATQPDRLSGRTTFQLRRVQRAGLPSR